MSAGSPKYALPEIERRFLVDVNALPPLDSATARLIEDRYLEGTRLRLRAISTSSGPPVYKLCKKYGCETPGAQPIVNVYLSPEEYRMLALLPGQNIRKRRYRVVEGNAEFAVDLFEEILEGLAIAEVEGDSVEAVNAIPVPEWATREITGEADYAGDRLCRPEVFG